jgi:hypothetical protein
MVRPTTRVARAIDPHEPTRRRSRVIAARASIAFYRRDRDFQRINVRQRTDDSPGSEELSRRQMRVRRHVLHLKWCTTVIDIARND